MNRFVKVLYLLMVAVSLAMGPVWAFAAFSRPDDAALRYARIDIDHVGPQRLAQLKATPGLRWWVELDRQLVVLADPVTLKKLQTERPIEVLDQVPVREAQLTFLRFDHFRDVDALDAHILGRGGRFALLQLRSTPPKTHHDGEHKHELYFDTFKPNSVLAAQSANRLVQRKRAVDADIQALVDRVDGDRWLADVTTLAEWNRYSYGSEIRDARDWLVARFEEIDGLTVTTEAFDRNGTELHNVVARIEGSVTPDRWYIIGGHYDSTSNNTASAAPGAEDNASGTAAVVEMARILAAMQPESTIIFMCYSGEEQGLYGSRDHVARLTSDGDLSKVQAVLTMDMIGYTGDADLDVLLETASRVSWMVDLLEQAATDYTVLRSVVSYNPFGSDHIPYLNAGLDSLLVIENDYPSYPAYHRTSDTIENVNLVQGRETIKMNVAVMADLIGFYRRPQVQWQPWLAKWRDRPDATAPDQNSDRIIDIRDLVVLLNQLPSAR